MNVRTNNAGNVVYCKNNAWIGQIGKYKQFAIFDNKQHGLRAMEIVLKSNISKEHTVTGLVHRYTNESLKHKHIQNYANAIKNKLGRDTIHKSDSEQLLPLIVYLEGGTKAFNYYFGVKNVRTRNAGFDYFVQYEIIKDGLHRRKIKEIKCYSLRDVLMAS